MMIDGEMTGIGRSNALAVICYWMRLSVVFKVMKNE